MKLISDMLADALVNHSVTHVFMTTADTALPAALRQHAGLEVVLTPSAEVSLLAATACAGVTQRPVVICLAPGAEGLMPVAQAGKPLLVLSSETDLPASAVAMTKYSVNLHDSQMVLYELQKALHLATTGSPGMVWMNIPPALQGLALTEQDLRHYDTPEREASVVSAMQELQQPVSVDALDTRYLSTMLSDHLPEDQQVVTLPSLLPTLSAQARLLAVRHGTALPTAIGACFGSGRKKMVCVTTLDCLQKHLSALATVRHYQLPIKLFVLLSSRQEGGLFTPDMEKITDAYEMQYVRAEAEDELHNSLAYALSTRRPTVCEIVMAADGVSGMLHQNPIAQAG